MREPSASEEFVVLQVVPMGWAWSVFFAQNVLTDVLEQDESWLGQHTRVSHGEACPQFDVTDIIHWLYVDDYGGMRLESEGCFEVENDSRKPKTMLEEVGLSSHKERWGAGLPQALGVELVGKTLRVSEAKMREAVLATEALVASPKVPARSVESLVGLWTWIMLVALAA